MRALIAPLVFGIAGMLVLLGLGSWQVSRLAEKEAYLAAIEARISQAPVALPLAPDPVADRFLSVTADGAFTQEGVDVLASRKGQGAGFRVITVFATEDGRRILTDRGFLPAELRDAPRSGGAARLTGNLHWPDEVDGFTPDPDRADNMWFARDVPALAAELKTEPVLLVVRETTEATPPATPFPVDTSGIPNDHLEYAITWFSLAAVWGGMTAYLMWRIRRRTV